MNVGIFGGTFDPVHLGHLAVARAAAQRYALKQVLFVPASRPPHKLAAPRTDFIHRYAMLALALAGEKAFVPSLLEAPDGGERPSYTIETIARAQAQLGRAAKLFLILGIDAFRDIATWHRAAELLRAVEVIVAGRPGFSLADVAASLPEELRPPAAVRKAMGRQRATASDLVLDQGRVVLHLLPEVQVPFSSTAARAAAAGGRSLARFVAPAVADYIRKQHLYRGEAAPAGKKRRARKS